MNEFLKGHCMKLQKTVESQNLTLVLENENIAALALTLHKKYHQVLKNAKVQNFEKCKSSKFENNGFVLSHLHVRLGHRGALVRALDS